MSKINAELLSQAIDSIVKYSQGETTNVNGKEVVGKKRKFMESIDLQFTLKNFDPRKDKRFAGSFKLPVIPRPNMSVCVLGDDVHCEQAKELGYPYLSVDDLKKMNKNKKLVRKLAKKHDQFVASQALIKQIPRLLGPGLQRAGKFPVVLLASDSLQAKVDEVKAQVKFQMKKVLCLSVAVANVEMSKEDITTNVQLSCNFLASLLKKAWQNIKVVYIKSTMGPTIQIYF
jgi:large subunit ribosomal protein L10Ae